MIRCPSFEKNEDGSYFCRKQQEGTCTDCPSGVFIVRIGGKEEKGGKNANS